MIAKRKVKVQPLKHKGTKKEFGAFYLVLAFENIVAYSQV